MPNKNTRTHNAVFFTQTAFHQSNPPKRAKKLLRGADEYQNLCCTMQSWGTSNLGHTFCRTNEQHKKMGGVPHKDFHAMTDCLFISESKNRLRCEIKHERDHLTTAKRQTKVSIKLTAYALWIPSFTFSLPKRPIDPPSYHKYISPFLNLSAVLNTNQKDSLWSPM